MNVMNVMNVMELHWGRIWQTFGTADTKAWGPKKSSTSKGEELLFKVIMARPQHQVLR